jgi:HlyD family secretion protein
MDRPLEQKEKRLAALKKSIKWILFLGILILGFVYLKNRFKPEVDPKKLFIATVEEGSIIQTLSASGTVVPAYEYTINAPVITEIKHIFLTNGAKVKPGSKILELDQEYTKLEYEKLKDELMLRKNNINKLKLLFDKELKDLDVQNQIKALRINETDALLKSQIRLKNIGGAAAEEVEKIKIQLDIMALEKKMLENDLQYKRTVNVVEKQNLELEYGIQAKKLQELQRKLTETTVTAEQEGVITWINENIGKTVQPGEPLVRIANLNQYRVEAVTSDRNMSYVKPGTLVRVRINQKDMNGTISHILPAIDNNTLKFHVTLEDPSSEILRPNQKTEVFIITDEKMNTLKLKTGPGINAAKTQYVYVVKNNFATKTKIEKGISNPDFVEIISPLKPGDQVIISDTEKFNHLTQFSIK